MAINIKPDGSVIIRVPLLASTPTIQKFITKYQSWINDKLETINANPPINDQLYYLGQLYPMVLTQKSTNTVEILENNILIAIKDDQDRPHPMLINWYKQQTISLVTPILKKYQAKYEITFNRLTITAAKTRWGSCSSRGNICFSYRLAMLPIYVIEYIVVHELAHLKYLNHSSKFWEHVGKLYPEYNNAEKWLKQHKYALAQQII